MGRTRIRIRLLPDGNIGIAPSGYDESIIAKMATVAERKWLWEERYWRVPATEGMMARLIELFGSWCPNCADAARYLSELDERYRSRGLRILGLAFEHTGDFARDAAQVKKYASYHGLQFPLLLAGVSDKASASAATSPLPVPLRRAETVTSRASRHSRDHIRGSGSGRERFLAGSMRRGGAERAFSTNRNSLKVL